MTPGDCASTDLVVVADSQAAAVAKAYGAGICDAPAVRERAVAAWGEHTWRECPMHAAYGWQGYDAGLLERPQ